MADDVVWIFAYGSLMWRPGFEHEASVPARLNGYHRSLCIYSIVHRGTPERPGMVLGLDRGGACRGWAFGIDPRREAEVLAYLDARELVTDVYRRVRLPLTVAGERVAGWCYVVRRDHQQYAGRLGHAELMTLIRDGVGRSGRCRDYVISTVSHLDGMGIVDGPLHAIAAELQRLPADDPSVVTGAPSPRPPPP